MSSDEPRVSNVNRAGRCQTRKKLPSGALSRDNDGDPEAAGTIGHNPVVTDTVCVLRHKGHAVCATRLSSEALEQELARRARQAEDEPVDLLTEMVNQLRSEIDQNLNGPSCLVASEGAKHEDLTVTLIKNLFAERIALEFYREALHLFREREAERHVTNQHE